MGGHISCSDHLVADARDMQHPARSGSSGWESDCLVVAGADPKRRVGITSASQLKAEVSSAII